MKQDYTLYIYKRDARCKTGERLYSTSVWRDRDQASMDREVIDLSRSLYRVGAGNGWRFEYVPTMKTVRNLMSGKDVQIPHDTPRSCDPSSETYWSM